MRPAYRPWVNPAAMHAPIAPTKPHVHREHDVERPDPWHWLKERDDPEVIAYIEAENAYCEERAARFAGLHQALFEESKGYIQETDQSVAVERRGFLYYSRTVEGLAYPIHCRREGSMEAPEQVILDINELARDHDYTSVVTIAISPDHARMAYAIDHTGRELYDIVVVDLTTGEVIDDLLKATGGDVTWATDSQTFFFDELDEALRPWRIRRHRVGEAGEDPIVQQEDDPRFRLFTSRTRSDAWIVLGSTSSKTREIAVIPADDPTAQPRLLVERHAGMKYSIDHQGDRFFVLTNDADDADGKHCDDAVNYKLMEMPVDGSGRESWVEVVPHRPDVQLAQIAAFENHLVLVEREGGLVHLRVRNLTTRADHRISMPESAYELGLSLNPTFETARLRFVYDSMVTPTTWFAYDMDSRERAVEKIQPVLGGFDPDDYRTERLYAPSTGGVQVPISIVYPKDYPRDGSGKLLLYGYGSYGITIDASFVSQRLVLLSRGVAFAIAHPRGGGLLGRPWYENGKLEHKQNTFDDFIAAARYLQEQGWTSPDRTAIYGGSAGGMLMGAVINQAPELFSACVAAVPFVDVVSTMLDESLPLTANEWEEWGNPTEPEPFRRMLSYSPYDNVHDDEHFPDLLIKSGLNDPRVQYWEPTKWCAKLRATVTNGAEILLKTHMGAGHQGPSGRYGHLEDRAFDYAFILDKFGLNDAG